MSRLVAPLLSVLLVAPGAPALAAGGERSGTDVEAGAVEVAAVVARADGRLSFVRQRATSRARGHELARRLRTRADVRAAAVVQPVRALGDPLQSQQWGLTALSAEQVWAGGTATGQRVAVLDTGVDATHPDLTGVVDPGLDLIGSSTGGIDPHGHGTHVAGVVAALAGNGVGGAGLGQGSTVLPVRVLDETGSGNDGDVAEGIVWAVDQGADVVNLSLGGDAPSTLLTTAVDYALKAGVPVVAASGNYGLDGDPVLYPAATPGVIAVGAVDAAGVRPGWSSSGTHLAVAAPGVGILSTVPGGGHSSWSGTSMAAPFVAAAAALLRAGEPALTPADLRTRLMATARDAGETGHDALYGAGLMDVLAARAAGVVQPVVEPAETVTEPVVEPVETVSEPVLSEPVVEPEPAPEPAPVVEPAPAPVVEPAPEPAPVVEPVVDPAPVPDLSPTPVADPRTAPSPSPSTVAPTPAPAPAPAPRLPTGMRTSRSAAVVLPWRPVTLAARILDGAAGMGDQPVTLERRVGAGPWTAIRRGTSRSDGLVLWTLRPDVTGEHRFRSGDVVSPSVAVGVRQAIGSTARRSGSRIVVDARVQPAGRGATVVLQVPRGSGWGTVATGWTDAAGVVRFVHAVPPGSLVRVHVRSRPALLPGTGPSMRP